MKITFLTLAKITASLLTIVALRALIRRGRRGSLTPGSLALITGGGSGIGLELARRFAQAGCPLILVGRSLETLRGAQAACHALGAPHVEIIGADLSTIEGTSKVVSIVRERYQQGEKFQQEQKQEKEEQGKKEIYKLKYLVLNAGSGAILPFSNSESYYMRCEDLMQINYFANVRLLQHLLPILESNNTPKDPSRVIVISSLAGILPSTLRTAYTASKHAIQGFMNALRGETNVAITLCCPGYVDTDFHRRAQLESNLTGASHRRGVPPDVCAKQCMDGVLRGDSEVITTMTGKLGYMLRPIFTKLVDAQAKKISMKSIKN